MGGFSSVTGQQTIMFADNASFDGTERAGAMDTDGQLWIGSTAAPNVRLGTLGSQDTTGQFVNGNGTISLSFSNASENLSVGDDLSAITSGNQNTSLGLNSLSSVTTGMQNTAIGYSSANLFSTGTQNTSIGAFSLGAGTTFNSCTAIGFSALQNTTGDSNTVVGAISSNMLTSGTQNTAIGYATLASLLTGVTNTCVGYQAGSAFTSTESSNINIGNIGVIGDSNTIRIGTQGSSQGQQDTCFIAGISGVTVAASIPVLIDANGQLGTILSSIRYKENVKDLSDTKVLDLRPVTFTYKTDQSRLSQIGLIAEEVLEIMPSLVVYNLENKVESVKYQDLSVLLLSELKKSIKRIEILEKEVKFLVNYYTSSE